MVFTPVLHRPCGQMEFLLSVFEDVLTTSSAVSEQQGMFLLGHAGEAQDLSSGRRLGCEDPPVPVEARGVGIEGRILPGRMKIPA